MVQERTQLTLAQLRRLLWLMAPRTFLLSLISSPCCANATGVACWSTSGFAEGERRVVDFDDFGMRCPPL
jgi:hypothetical protein